MRGLAAGRPSLHTSPSKMDVACTIHFLVNC
jgi:hypothetical protein